MANILRPGCSVPFHFSEEEIRRIVKQERNRYCAKQKYFRGLYCGGTFTEEGLFYYSNIPELPLFQLDTDYARKLPDFHVSMGHTILIWGLRIYQGGPSPGL